MNQRVIRWNGERTQEFVIGQGARQGCIASLHLFVTYTEKGMHDMQRSQNMESSLGKTHFKTYDMHDTSNFVFLIFSLKFIPFPTSFTLLVSCTVSSSEFAISAKLLVAGADPDEVQHRG